MWQTQDIILQMHALESCVSDEVYQCYYSQFNITIIVILRDITYCMCMCMYMYTICMVKVNRCQNLVQCMYTKGCKYTTCTELL